MRQAPHTHHNQAGARRIATRATDGPRHLDQQQDGHDDRQASSVEPFEQRMADRVLGLRGIEVADKDAGVDRVHHTGLTPRRGQVLGQARRDRPLRPEVLAQPC